MSIHISRLEWLAIVGGLAFISAMLFYSVLRIQIAVNVASREWRYVHERDARWQLALDRIERKLGEPR